MRHRSAAIKALRYRRLDRHDDGRFLIVPMDHAVSSGPIVNAGELRLLVDEVSGNGADAIVLHRGTAANLDPAALNDAALIVHLSASTDHALDPDAKYLVASVESALRLGADAVSVHVNMGSDGEPAQIADLGRVAELCDRWSLPLLAMMYPRGPRVNDAASPALIRHAAVLAAELGADVVKVPRPVDAASMADIVAACPTPVVVAGGAPGASRDQLLGEVRAAVAAGASGVAMGRKIFGAERPGELCRLLARAIHRPEGEGDLARGSNGDGRERRAATTSEPTNENTGARHEALLA